ncbi:MAG: SRPBCC domain-containing protein [Dongiaceae bacterium]
MEGDRLFAALAEGSLVGMPLGKTFFSPSFGMTVDRFGVTWMIIVGHRANPVATRQGRSDMTGIDGLIITTPSDREIAITRAFDAPRAQVFEALTKPELIQRWLLGPPGYTMPVCQMDLRVGGAYRFVWRGSDGAEMGAGGVFREIQPPQRIVNTEKFDQPWYLGEALVTNQVVERDGKAMLTLTIRYQSREVRDMVLASPMKQGVAASYVRLAAMLATPSAG